MRTPNSKSTSVKWNRSLIISLYATYIFRLPLWLYIQCIWTKPRAVARLFLAHHINGSSWSASIIISTWISTQAIHTESPTLKVVPSSIFRVVITSPVGSLCGMQRAYVDTTIHVVIGYQDHSGPNQRVRILARSWMFITWLTSKQWKFEFHGNGWSIRSTGSGQYLGVGGDAYHDGQPLEALDAPFMWDVKKDDKDHSVWR